MKDEMTLAALREQINELRRLNANGEIDLSSEILLLEEKLRRLTAASYAKLADWDRVKLSRHPQRPYALDYIPEIFGNFYELHGDRIYGDDRAMIVGLAKLKQRTVMIVAQQKGRTPEEKKERFFGMSRPQGYRKALRVMKLAERFSFPVITLIDTPGAYPGIESEELNISGAIANNLQEMSQLKVPTIAIVIGEGGSGGALAIGVADRIMMLENATYSVISPEGCAAILWRDNGMISEAARALGLTASRLKELGLIDEIIPESLGGAHTDLQETAANLKEVLIRHLSYLSSLSNDELLKERYARYRFIGRYRILPKE
ncbi:acetyl-CoA carboxylase carboxyltransferase subunit alpha [Candidatus Acetothermia bacterium]|jgi:acetyl-CoA carboxylase carboxyl transferase subunit alpha|nr:acetyl-CoA carboxylase carboxyltransferase subunit alpha [Candidatus Acetothermia bacterium]MCI2427402.1 acetyl-CoA carboxylase carboxyltransferase subunit alpha [Candidatus Acetothermia bacterium]MCI2428557.1 acetyl-CoA carboxylase carboxyltransferase subunit alpha [Candidatus Acetothermia bacterium]